jgi:HK97 gp10 family phage protein
MARFDARVTVDTRRLNQIIANLEGNTHDYVRAVAFAVEAAAKPLTAIDTGALRNSIYTRVGSEDGGPKAHQEARQRNPDAELVELPRPKNETTAHVGPGVDYGLAQEFGTRTQAGQPFLIPAVQEVTRQMERGFMSQARKVVTDG